MLWKPSKADTICTCCAHVFRTGPEARSPDPSPLNRLAETFSCVGHQPQCNADLHVLQFVKAHYCTSSLRVGLQGAQTHGNARRHATKVFSSEAEDDKTCKKEGKALPGVLKQNGETAASGQGDLQRRVIWIRPRLRRLHLPETRSLSTTDCGSGRRWKCFLCKTT